MEHVSSLLHPGAGGFDSVRAFQGEFQVSPHKVALAGTFHLDNLGAHFCGEKGGERLGNDGATGQNLYALQRPEYLRNEGGCIGGHVFLPVGVERL